MDWSRFVLALRTEPRMDVCVLPAPAGTLGADVRQSTYGAQHDTTRLDHFFSLPNHTNHGSGHHIVHQSMQLQMQLQMHLVSC